MATHLMIHIRPYMLYMYIRTRRYHHQDSRKLKDGHTDKRVDILLDSLYPSTSEMMIEYANFVQIYITGRRRRGYTPTQGH